MVQKALDAVCDQVAGCHTVAFADLSTQMVLVANTSTKQSRDALNILVQQAQQALRSGQIAMVGTDDAFHVFARSADDPTEALCCMCGLDTDIEQLSACLVECFRTISAGSGAA